jgi:hypothetical protein
VVEGDAVEGDGKREQGEGEKNRAVVCTTARVLFESFHDISGSLSEVNLSLEILAFPSIFRRFADVLKLYFETDAFNQSATSP